MPRHVSVSDAHAETETGSMYVDVRSTGEFAQGHPAGAFNIPLFEPDERTGMMQPNPDFVRVVTATFLPDTKLVIGCQAGGRSARAMHVLESFGFTDVANVLGGFGGAHDPIGRFEPGWASSNLPVDTTARPGHSYDELLAHADAAE
jgi:rhodanese-related sulfurtransferase